MQIKIHYFCSLAGFISKAKPNPLGTYTLVNIKYDVCSLKCGSHYNLQFCECVTMYVGLLGNRCLCATCTHFLRVFRHIFCYKINAWIFSALSLSLDLKWLLSETIIIFHIVCTCKSFHHHLPVPHSSFLNFIIFGLIEMHGRTNRKSEQLNFTDTVKIVPHKIAHDEKRLLYYYFVTEQSTIRR